MRKIIYFIRTQRVAKYSEIKLFDKFITITSLTPPSPFQLQTLLKLSP